MRRKVFSEEERCFLANLVGENVEIESKRTDAISVVNKLKKWKEITEKFNASGNVVKRTTQQLRTCWKNMKIKAKKHINSERRSLVKTGGGPTELPAGTHAVEDTIAPLPSKIFEPIDTDVGDVKPIIYGEAGPSDPLTAEDAVITKVEEPLVEGVGNANEVSRLHSSYNKTSEGCRLPLVTPKKIGAKNVGKSCELDVELLNHKISTERMLQDEITKKKEYLNLEIKCAKAEEEKVKREMQFMEEKHQKEMQLMEEKHRKELICIDAQTKYWESMQTSTK